jgi:hypothetical protein
MTTETKYGVKLDEALGQGLLKRLPITFLPFVNQQLAQWSTLFPNEQRATERLLLYVADLSDEQAREVFAGVVALEEKMGVRTWDFSTTEQTILNASLLARSPYFQQWRQAVQQVFDAADAHAGASAERGGNRLVVMSFPQQLPVESARAWRRWNNAGRIVALEPGGDAHAVGVMEQLLRGADGAPGLLATVSGRVGAVKADAWVMDAGRSLVDVLVDVPSSDGGRGAILLSNGRLDMCREKFSHEMNTMRKDIADADAVYDQLRKVNVEGWCPSEVVEDKVVREFVRSLYLSGNGALIYGNSFVQWASSEGLRRARPRLLAAEFGARAKPKPFTGVAVFDDPDKVNPLPSVEDLPGSAVDAEMLALYVWLAAMRYDEYARGTACVCVAENLREAYVVGPTEFPLLQADGAVSITNMRTMLTEWMG